MQLQKLDCHLPYRDGSFKLKAEMFLVRCPRPERDIHPHNCLRLSSRLLLGTLMNCTLARLKGIGKKLFGISVARSDHRECCDHYRYPADGRVTNGMPECGCGIPGGEQPREITGISQRWSTRWRKSMQISSHVVQNRLSEVPQLSKQNGAEDRSEV